MQILTYLPRPARQATGALSAGAKGLLCLALGAAALPAQAGAWRLADAMHLPAAISLRGAYRLRYETVDRQFRANGGGDQVFVQRLNILAEAHLKNLTLGAELLDAREGLADSGSFINTTIVNAAELLQAYIKLDVDGYFGDGSKTSLRFGRITMDVGSRRLVARNRFRNTINGFTGLDWQWQGKEGNSLRAFFAFPVIRRPSARTRLLNNHAEFDDDDTDTKFWGLYYAPARLPWGDDGEVFVFGLHESDSATRSTRNRDLITPGFRLYRKPASKKLDYLIESFLQFGESRASSSIADLNDLDHFAFFQHLEAGYSLPATWSPRVAAQFDYASGDDDPNDGNNNRFDTLFGARRFDFGPTGIYGPFARANLISPGLRVQLRPASGVSGFLSYRGYWLASSQDAWTTARIQDPSGNSGSFVGHQVELRLRWDPQPGTVRLETGFALLFAGSFLNNAPNTVGAGDTNYFYSQVAFRF